MVGELIDDDSIAGRLRAKDPDMMRLHFTEHHLTPKELGELASRTGANQLVAVHIPIFTKYGGRRRMRQ